MSLTGGFFAGPAANAGTIASRNGSAIATPAPLIIPFSRVLLESAFPVIITVPFLKVIFLWAWLGRVRFQHPHPWPTHCAATETAGCEQSHKRGIPSDIPSPSTLP